MHNRMLLLLFKLLLCVLAKTRRTDISLNMVRPSTSVARAESSAALFTSLATGSAEDAKIRIEMERERMRKFDPSADIVIELVVAVSLGDCCGCRLLWLIGAGGAGHCLPPLSLPYL